MANPVILAGTNIVLVPTLGISRDGRLHILNAMAGLGSLCGQPNAGLTDRFSGTLDEFRRDRVRCPECDAASASRRAFVPRLR